MTKRAPIREPEPKKPPHREPPNSPPSRKEPPTNEPPREEPDNGGSPMKVGREYGDGPHCVLVSEERLSRCTWSHWATSSIERLRMCAQT
jgi:hypothetical protein